MASQKFNSETAIGMLFMSSDDSDSEVNYSSDDCVSIIYIKFNLLEIMHIYIYSNNNVKIKNIYKFHFHKTVYFYNYNYMITMQYICIYLVYTYIINI